MPQSQVDTNGPKPAKAEVKTRHIVIVGMDPASRELANQQPEDAEIWALNAAHQFLKRADAWFQIHERVEGRFDMEVDARADAEHQNFLQSFPGPVYTVDVDPLIPTSVRFPLEEMLEEFGDYFTSTPCYMLALAIHELKRGDMLTMVGISMGEGIEYVAQKAGIEYFLGIARGRGITVRLPGNTPLLQAPLYGRGERWEAFEKLNQRYIGLKLHKAQVEKQVAELAAKMEECEHAMLLVTGMRPPELSATSSIIFRQGAQVVKEAV